MDIRDDDMLRNETAGQIRQTERISEISFSTSGENDFKAFFPSIPVRPPDHSLKFMGTKNITRSNSGMIIVYDFGCCGASAAPLG